jgi:hypothetical protein
MGFQKWEYCLLTCTPMTGLESEGVRVAYQVAAQGRIRRDQVVSDDPSPIVAIARLLDELGRDGWELLTYDTTTNRGVLKRPICEREGT